MATLVLNDDDAPLYTLAYFTSDWVRSVDAVVLPRLRAVLDGVNALYKKRNLVGLLEVRRMDGGTGDADISSDKTQRLEPSTFGSLCKLFRVTDVPACVLLDAQGQALTLKSLKALQNELLRHYEDDNDNVASMDSDSPWNVLGELLKDSGAPAAAWGALQPLWNIHVSSAGANIPKPLDVTDPKLVRMREEALKLFETGQFLPALSSFVRVLLHCPTCTKSSFNLAVILQMIGETYFAVSSMLRVVALDDSDSVAHTVLRSVYYQEEPDIVAAGYRLIVASNRNSHLRAVHSLATLEGATTTKTAAPAYVAEVFDELANTFEEKLVAHLEYRVPWQLVKALQKLSPPGFIAKDSTAESEWVVADVGCGTGLCGRLLRSHVKHIVGVDISPLMIEKTRAGGSYDELHTVGIVPFLEACADETLDLIISADVWIYVGALEQVFELSRRKLRASTGWMAFSIELLPSGIVEDAKDSANETSVGFRLALSGRFQHSHEYVTSLASRWGLTVAIQQDVSVRKESGEPIPGRIYLLHRVDDSQKNRRCNAHHKGDG
ncbi:Methyltransferase domain [Phytophthora infestans]|uniref:Methyltransferase domain n=1 Tax=Phytophthora infestans TaxID=4787 RepID=A0A833S888_PHYIN|nr:Methyltransferase domain [Phytophthora infestans]